jgi:hypothetical protein
LPKDTSQEVTLVWPQLVAKDELKESQRGQILNGSGILSKRTWAKNEGLDYEDEVENMSLDNELEVSHASEMDQHSNPQNPQMSGFLKNARAAEQQKIDNANAGKPNGNGSVNPFEKKTQAEALMFENFDDLDLNQLDEVIDSTIDDPALYGAMVSYMKVARKVTRRDHAMSQNRTASRRKKKRQWRMA